MGVSLSKEELIEVYKDLYLKDGNTEYFKDYESLVSLYKLYFSLFFSEKSNLYLDYEYIRYVVDGFHYMNETIFGEEKVSYKDIVSTLHERDSEIREKNKNSIFKKEKYTDSDTVLFYTLNLAMGFKGNHFREEFYQIVQKALFNAYVICREEGKDKGGIKLDGVEYQKCKN